MEHAREPRDDPAHGVVRHRGRARRRGDHDAGALSVARVTVYHAADCSLCAQALGVVRALHQELRFELELVDIGGRADLEARYRELLPAVEVEGELAFTYFVDRDALRTRVLTVRPARSNEP